MIWKWKWANEWNQGSTACPAFAVTSAGVPIIVTADYQSIAAFNVNNGSLMWSAEWGPGCGSLCRVEAGVTMTKGFLGTDDLAFCIGQDSTTISCFDENGNHLSGLYEKRVAPSTQTSRAVTSLVFATLQKGGEKKIIAGAAVTPNNYGNTFIVQKDGTIERQLPANGTSDGVALGVFMKNHAVADIDGDGNLEIITPSDEFAICAWKYTGEHCGINTTAFPNSYNRWGNVIFSKTAKYEKDGWNANAPSTERRPFFALAPTTVFKINSKIVIGVSGMLSDFTSDPPNNVVRSMFLLNPDRTRYKDTTLGFDWTESFDFQKPLEQSYSNMASNPNAIHPVDVDGDGYPELLYNGDDGYVHCVWMDGKEHYGWPYAVKTADQPRLATEIVAFQRPGEGTVIVFGSYASEDYTYKGKIHFVKHNGDLITEVDLPAAQSTARTYSGARGGLTLFRNPTISNKNLFLTLHTFYAGNVLFEILETANATILFQTSRGNFERDGNPQSTSTDTFNTETSLKTIQQIASIIFGVLAALFSCVFLVILISSILVISFVFSSLSKSKKEKPAKTSKKTQKTKNKK